MNLQNDSQLGATQQYFIVSSVVEDILYPIYIDACGVNIMLYAYPHVSVFSTQDTKSVGNGNQKNATCSIIHEYNEGSN